METRLYRATETHDDRIRRLAREAIERQVLIVADGTRYTAIEPGKVVRRHAVTMISCDCYCFCHTGACVHHAALLASFDALPRDPIQIALPNASFNSEQRSHWQRKPRRVTRRVIHPRPNRRLFRR